MIKIDVYIEQKFMSEKNSLINKIISPYRKLLNKFEKEINQHNYQIRIDIIRGRFAGIHFDNIPQETITKIVDYLMIN